MFLGLQKWSSVQRHRDLQRSGKQEINSKVFELLPGFQRRSSFKGIIFTTKAQIGKFKNQSISVACESCLEQGAVWAVVTFKQLKSWRPQSFRVPSAEEVAKIWSTGENCTHQIPRLCPVKTPSKEQSGQDHSLASRSCEPVAMSLSFGDTATLFMS